MRALAAFALLLVGSSPYDDGTTPFDVSPTAAAPTTTTSAISKAPVFDFNPDAAVIASGPGLLSDSITINGATPTLMLSCDARNISGSTWSCTSAAGAVTLNEAGAGASPVVSSLHPFTEAGARVVTFASTGKRYETPALALGTDDLIVEWAGSQAIGVNAGVLQTGTFNDGVTLFNNGGGSSWFGCLGGACASLGGPSDGLSGVQTFTYSMMFLDRDEASANGWISYSANSGYGFNVRSTGNPSAFSSIALNGAWKVGTGATGVNNVDNGLVALRIWKCAPGVCLRGGADNLTSTAFAKDRNAALFGLYPGIAAFPLPTAQRYPPAYVDINDGTTTRLVRSAAPRVARRKDSDGVIHECYLDEPAATNYALQSQTLGTSWTHTAATVTSDAVVAPDGTTTADTLVLTGAGSVSIATATYANGSYTNSIYVRGGTATDNVLVYDGNGTSWNSFTPSTCAINGACGGAACATVVARASDLGGGWCRFEVSQSAVTGAASFAAFYFAGAAGQTMTFWGEQFEDQPTATSYIPTTAAAATRNVDTQLVYDIATPASAPAALEASFMLDAHTSYLLEARGRTPLRLGANWSNPSFYLFGEYCGLGAKEYDDVLYGAQAGPAYDYCATYRKHMTVRGIFAPTSITAWNVNTMTSTTTAAAARNPATAKVYVGGYANVSAVGCITRARVWPRAWSPAEVP